MVWLVEKKVFHYILDLGYEGAAIPIRVKFEFEVREGAIIPQSLKFTHLYNRKAILNRYPNVKSELLEQNIHKMVKLRIHEYLIQNGYLNEESGNNEIVQDPNNR